MGFKERLQALALGGECRGKLETIPKQDFKFRMLEHTAWIRPWSQAEEYRGERGSYPATGT